MNASHFLRLFVSSFKQRHTSLIAHKLLFWASVYVNHTSVGNQVERVNKSGLSLLPVFHLLFLLPSTHPLILQLSMSSPFDPFVPLYSLLLLLNTFLLTRSCSSPPLHNFTLPPTAGTIYPAWPSILHQENDSNMIALHLVFRQSSVKAIIPPLCTKMLQWVISLYGEIIIRSYTVWEIQRCFEAAVVHLN